MVDMKKDPESSTVVLWNEFLLSEGVLNWIDQERIPWGAFHAKVAMKFLEWSTNNKVDNNE